MKIEDNGIKWEKLTERLGTMMLNSDVAQKNQLINVLILIMVDQIRLVEFNGMQQYLSKFVDGRMIFTIQTFTTSTAYVPTHDFILLLMHSDITSYTQILKKYFFRIFPDLSTKIFVIITGSLEITNAGNVWNTLTLMGYTNVYVVLHHKFGHIKLFRTQLIVDIFEMIKSQDIKYVTIKEMPEYAWVLYINVVFYNSYPMSYIHNGEIIGAEGKLMQEFSRRIKIPHRVVNKNFDNLQANEVLYFMRTAGDICLFSNLNLNSDSVESVPLNEMDGLCVLTPRNIPVSSYDNLALPLDVMSLIMSFISTISVIVSWKVISTYKANGRSLKSIVVAVLEMAFNIGVSGIEQISKKEVILLYSFIFSSIVLVSFYESLLLAFMLAEPSWRSAHDLTELNDSGAKFYTFYKRDYFGRIPYIREELIQNLVDVGTIESLNVPNNFDHNMVYLVTCKYADSFMKSTRNFDEKRRKFDVIKISEMFQAYPVRKGFLYEKEFMQIVRIWAESGIHKYWQTQSIENEMKSNKQSNNQMEQSYDVQFLLNILIIGLSLSFGVFLYEILMIRFNSLCLDQIRVTKDKLQNPVFKKMLRLSKWKNKFIYKKKLRKSKMKIYKSRETIFCGYFLLKKVRKSQKSKQFPRIIQVRTCNKNRIIE
ncbi:unnamed protein product [Chironomus riparius]|uniref:Ionotropic receptor n=1 Tax=Chironomus riparius TaxID=315576 RepID=A0A9N9WSH9_9DIPT|nr:unnamed protein product [Chironomus riparius]